MKQQINPVAYRLDLPPSVRMHDVFHVSLLRLYRDGGRVGTVGQVPTIQQYRDEGRCVAASSVTVRIAFTVGPDRWRCPNRAPCLLILPMS